MVWNNCKCTKVLTGQSDEGIFSTEVPFSQASLVYVKLTKTTSPPFIGTKTLPGVCSGGRERVECAFLGPKIKERDKSQKQEEEMQRGPAAAADEGQRRGSTASRLGSSRPADCGKPFLGRCPSS